MKLRYILNRLTAFMFKKIFAFLCFCILYSCTQKSHQTGASIKGTILHSNQEYILLAYNPRQRGNLNFDDFKSVGTYIDKKGNFSLTTDKLTDKAIYSLEFANQNQSITLFDGDDITITFDINNANDTFFATGKGAGKLNVMHLSQFVSTFPVETKNSVTLNEYLNVVEIKIASQLAFLHSIYTKKIDDTVIQSATNKELIARIVNETPLSKKEYDFLQKLIKLQRFSMVSNFLTMKSSDDVIDFERSKQLLFNTSQYEIFDHLNNWKFTHALEQILKIEYIIQLQKEEAKYITYTNWQSFLYTPAYDAFCFNFLKENFPLEVLNKYHFDLKAWLLTIGIEPSKSLESFTQQQSPNKYTERVQQFQNLLDTSLQNDQYNLADTSKKMNSEKLDALISSSKEKPVYIVFWSAKFAGASLIKQLPVFKEIERQYANNVNFVYICVDKQQYKNLWAARIIDNSWKATHYFLAEEGNENILKLFGDKPIDQFCLGGANFAYITKEGSIQHNLPSFANMNKEEVAKLFH